MQRFLKLIAALTTAALLSGCVVYPVGHGHRGGGYYGGGHYGGGYHGGHHHHHHRGGRYHR
ncbi:MAG: hypothetical protein FJY56_18120 [Betaproteobacteria bacterium]|nr:hypothetical protein [Betaproteobacteria bacterium]